MAVHGEWVIPLQHLRGVRFEFQITMAVRFDNNAWKATVNQLIKANQAEIDAMLTDYGVPLRELIIRETLNEDDDDD